MSLDLSNSADFALLTGSSVAEVAQLFGRNPAEWTIEEASYDGVPFHIFKSATPYAAGLSEVRDSGGRRVVSHQFPYRDGQTTDDLGRMPERFEVEALLHGNNYQVGLNELFKVLQKPLPGYLVHPVRGVVRCKMADYQLIHSADTRKAVAVNITFVEHNFDIASYGRVTEVRNFKSRLSDALAVFNAIQQVKNKITAAQNLFNSVKNVLTNLYDGYQQAFLETTVSINSVFNTGESIDIPSLLPVSQGGVFGPDGSLVSSRFPSAVNPNDPFRNIPVTAIQAAVEANRAIYASQQFESVGALEGTTDPATTAGSVGLQALASAGASLQAIIVQNQINSTRSLADTLAKSLAAVQFNFPVLGELGTDNDGALEYSNEILDLKRSGILLQDAYELGSDQAQIGVRRIVTDRILSIRELAFEAGLSPDRSLEIDLLNPELTSTNYIGAGTEVYVPL